MELLLEPPLRQGALSSMFVAERKADMSQRVRNLVNSKVTS